MQTPAGNLRAAQGAACFPNVRGSSPDFSPLRLFLAGQSSARRVPSGPIRHPAAPPRPPEQIKPSTPSRFVACYFITGIPPPPPPPLPTNLHRQPGGAQLGGRRTWDMEPRADGSSGSQPAAQRPPPKIHDIQVPLPPASPPPATAASAGAPGPESAATSESRAVAKEPAAEAGENGCSAKRALFLSLTHTHTGRVRYQGMPCSVVRAPSPGVCGARARARPHTQAGGARAAPEGRAGARLSRPPAERRPGNRSGAWPGPAPQRPARRRPARRPPPPTPLTTAHTLSRTLRRRRRHRPTRLHPHS